MHHVDVTPSAADVARPSAPRDVTVALETRAGCLRAYHRRPGRPGDLGYPVAPTVTATPGTTLVLPAVQAEPATRSRRPPPPARGSRPPLPPSRPARSPAQTPCRWPSAGRPPLLDRPGSKRRGHRWHGDDHRGTLDRWCYHHPAPV